MKAYETRFRELVFFFYRGIGFPETALAPESL